MSDPTRDSWPRCHDPDDIHIALESSQGSDASRGSQRFDQRSLQSCEMARKLNLLELRFMEPVAASPGFDCCCTEPVATEIHVILASSLQPLC